MKSYYGIRRCFLLLALCTFKTAAIAITIIPKFASLTAHGLPFKITLQGGDTKHVSLKTSKQLIADSLGNISCIIDFDPKNCAAWVVAIDTISGTTDTCKVSVVPWTANLSRLSINKIEEPYKILGKTEDTMYLVFNNVLYKTGQDLSKIVKLSPFVLSNEYFSFLQTPSGSFIRDGAAIYFSKDEKKWDLDYTTKGRGIRNSFAFTYDSISKTTRVFAHDYSVTGQDTFRHAVYRKIIDPTNQKQPWEKVLIFYSKDEWKNNKSLFPACRHIHTLVVDPFTGHIWIGTGDDDLHSHIYYSPDQGHTWNHVGLGGAEWRVLSIWFTHDYIYWSTDNPSIQKIFRIPRSVYDRKNLWPDMSERLDSGLTQVGIRYFIQNVTDKRYDNTKTAGSVWLADKKVAIDPKNVVYSLNDPALDYREKVAELPNSALWGHTWVKDQTGDSLVLLSANAEGHSIDTRARVFGIKERINGTVDVQELLALEGTSVYSQIYPYEQDHTGNIYFQAQFLKGFRYNYVLNTSLIWHDNSYSKGGKIVPVSQTADSSKVKLKLIQYDGSVLQWQQSDQTFQWKNLPKALTPDISFDTISVGKEKNKIKYIRAIVQKENESSVASEYFRVDSLHIRSITTSITEINADWMFTCYPIPTHNTITIRSNTAIIEPWTLELLTLQGVLRHKQIASFSDTHILELPLDNLSKGIYILKISNKSHIYKHKIILT